MRRDASSHASLFPLLAALFTMVGCAAGPTGDPMPTVDRVDLNRFMGDWYVIANIPTFLERGAHNAVENYRLDDDGTIETTFTYRKGGFDGEQKKLTARGFVRDADSNALWGMQFIWPFKADYRVAYLDDAYSQTIIARQQRDYVWIMARSPSIDDASYARLVREVSQLGYDTNKLERVPQSW